MTAEAPKDYLALLVEDSAIIALDLDDMLRLLGAREVVVAPDVTAALAEIERHAFDVALLDVNLGGETSLRIAESLAERGVPFVFSSGYGEEEAVKARFPEAPVLAKPYSAGSLGARLAQAFARRPAATES